VVQAPRIENLTVTKTSTGIALVDGQGCVSGAPVSISVDGTHVANTVADGNGAFSTTFSTGTTPAGQHQVQALCGPTLNAVMDIVLVSSIGTPAATMATLVLFLLMVGWLQRGRLATAVQADDATTASLVHS
jgi:hypothetical protein